jgi:hypothetical protein
MTPETHRAGRCRRGLGHGMAVAGLLTLGTASVLSLPLLVPQPTTVVIRDVANGARASDPASATAPRLAPVALGGPAPTRLELPGLAGGISAPVDVVGVSPQGDLSIPDDPNRLGWWDGGAAPAANTGTVVIDGHVDSDDYGDGFFVNLRRLQAGDPIALTDAAGSRTSWTVVEVGEYPATSLADTGVFTQQATPRLALITCGGPFDRIAHRYLNNLVVYAVPTGAANDLD